MKTLDIFINFASYFLLWFLDNKSLFMFFFYTFFFLISRRFKTFMGISNLDSKVSFYNLNKDV